MRTEDLSKTTLLGIQAAGLSITALAVLVIAFSVQLGVRAFSGGALHPDLGVLSLLFVSYVITNAVAYATSQEPDLPLFVLANAALQIGFLCVGWFLYLSDFPPSWLAFAVGFVLLVHLANFGFARLRALRVRRLLEHGVATPQPAVERCFFASASMHLTVPLGAALGSMGAALSPAPAAELLRHVLGGVFATVAAGLFIHMLGGARELARDLVEAHGEPRVTVRAVSRFDRYTLHVWAPVPSETNADASLLMARIAADVRRVLVINQLQRATLFAIACLVLWRLEWAALPAVGVLAALLAITLLATQLPYGAGQLRTNARVLGALAQEGKHKAAQQLSRYASPALLPSAWVALCGACAVSALAYACAVALVRRFAG